jgi:type II secretion system protein J
VLDRSLEMSPERQVLLANVNSVTLRFLDQSDQWQDHWPPLNAEQGAYLRQDPLAVEITIDTKHWGPIKRLIGVAQ